MLPEWLQMILVFLAGCVSYFGLVILAAYVRRWVRRLEERE